MEYSPLLKDPAIFPGDTILKKVLGKGYDPFIELLELYRQNGIAWEWRYYNDGKMWLCKITKKTKTNTLQKEISMMHRLFLTTLLAILLQSGLSYSQTKTGWTQYCGMQSAMCVASRGEICWIGNNGGGLYRINTQTNDVTHYTNLNSGLPSNQIYDLCCGSDNVVWVATEEGLTSFDGISWQVFNRENKLFSSNSVRAINIDGQSNLWVPTTGALFCVKNNQWINIFDQNPGFPLELLSGTSKITCIGSNVYLAAMNSIICLNNGTWKSIPMTSAYFISNDETIWYLSTAERVLRGLKADTTKSIPLPAYVLPAAAFVIDSSGTAWIYRNDTLYSEKVNQWSTVMIPQTFRDSTAFSFIELDDIGRLWFSGKKGFLSYAPARNEWQSFPVVFTYDYSYAYKTKLAIDADNKLWTISSGGIYYYDSTTWTSSEPFQRNGVTVDIVSDKLGRIHCIAIQKGIPFPNTEPKDLLLEAVNDSRTGDNTWSITLCTLQTRLPNLFFYNLAKEEWILNANTLQKGNQIFSLRNNQSTLIPYPVKDSSINIISFNATNNGTLWALIRGNLLFRFQNGTWEKSQPDQTLASDTITGIIGGGGDTLWIGTGKGDLARYDGSQWQIVPTTLSDSSLLCPLHFDLKRGELWCSVFRKGQIYYSNPFTVAQTFFLDGLYCYNGTKGTHHTTATSGIFDSYIKSVATDENGIWVASYYGLSYWDRRVAATTFPKRINKNVFDRLTGDISHITVNNQLKLYLDASGIVSISIYNLNGRLIKTIEAGKRDAGLNLIRLSDYGSCIAQNMIIIKANVKKL
jgi:ligand-binding sensor domain-containing protein